MTTPKLSHDYTVHLTWEGNRGAGTATYAGYDRRYRVRITGKPDLVGSADAAFRGDAALHNPEDLFVAAIVGCHMLAYLALCARAGVRVVAYEDDAIGTLALDPLGGGAFTHVVLRPTVTVADAVHVERARALHDAAHARCFIAASCRMPVTHEPTVRVAESVPAVPSA